MENGTAKLCQKKCLSACYSAVFKIIYCIVCAQKTIENVNYLVFVFFFTVKRWPHSRFRPGN